MWAGHGGSTDGVGCIRVTNPSRSDVYTWGEDVDAGTIVGERCTGITDVGGTNGDGLKYEKKGLYY